MNFYKLTNKFKCNKSEDYTHVSMLPYGGVYKIPLDSLDQFYTDYQACIASGIKLGVLERPKDEGPMLVDVDISLVSSKIISLYTRDDVLRYVECFQNILRDYTKSKTVDCFVLEKTAYMKNGRCKNGFHLHFPYVWMTRDQRKLITKVGRTTLDPDTIDDSAVKNNWFLYGSRKTAGQGAYKVSYVVNSRGETSALSMKKEDLIRTLSIRNNPTGVTTTIVESIWLNSKPKPRDPRPKRLTKSLNDSLITRCLESLDSSRADDYCDWIKIGCILFTIDALDGYQRWKEFSKQSYKYDEDYLFKTCNRFKEYNYTVGSLVYLAKQDDPNFDAPSKPRLLFKRDSSNYTVRQLSVMCKDRKIRGYGALSKSKLCERLGIPSTPSSNECTEFFSSKKTKPKEVTLVDVNTLERKTFKSIYSAAKSIGVNPGSVYIRRDMRKTLKSKVNTCEYLVET